MIRRSIVAALATIAVLPTVAAASLTVNPAQPITRQVSVQIIQTALDNGTSPATIFGDATQTAGVEAGIDTIWAQAGIDINFLSTIAHYNNTFAYQGTAGSGTRSQNDLGTMLTNARNQGGILNPSSSVIDMFFVNVTPGFAPLSENTSAGLANIGNNGIAVFVGNNLLGFQNGRDVVAGVVAHEIGHNLGLKHPADGLPNLMSPSGTTEQLSADQIAAVLQTTSRNDAVAFIPSGGTGFPQSFTAQLTGDYNHNGIVDAADYSVWRDTLGSVTNLSADGNGDRVINIGDYTVWKTNFGRTGAGGVGAAVPEPATWIQCLVAAALAVFRRKCVC
jgi:reprolysin-like metallo-peptidase family M12B